MAEKKILSEKKIFWIRFSLYIMFGWMIPVAFLIWRFNLFTKIDSVSIGGWGIIAIIFTAGFFINLMKQVRKGLPYSLGTQCLEGYMKIVIPLITAILCIYALQNFIEQLNQFLIVLVISEAIAIPLNPFPKWIHDNNLEQEENKIKKFIDFFWSRKKD